MIRARAPVFLALGLMLALAAVAQATITPAATNIKVTWGSAPVYVNSIGVGPYSLTIDPDPIRTSLGTSDTDLLPCLNAQTEAGPPSGWWADAYWGDNLGSTGVHILGTSSYLNDELAWEDWYLGKKMGGTTGGWQTDGSLTTGVTSTDLAKIHAAIWKLGGGIPTQLAGYTTDANALALEAQGAWAARSLTDRNNDLAKILVLLPKVHTSGAGPLSDSDGRYGGYYVQPFLEATTVDIPHEHDVPEPGTWALLLMGVAMTVMTCRKRRQAA